MNPETIVKSLAVRIVPAFPRRFYLYADEPGPSYERLVEILQARGLAEPHMRSDRGTVIIGARTVAEDIPTRVPFGALAGPQLAGALADAFRDLAVRAGIGVRVYIRKDQHEMREGDQVELGPPGADLGAGHAALHRLLNEAAARAGLLALNDPTGPIKGLSS